MKNQTKFIIDQKMPYIEFRYSNSSKNYKEHMHDTFSIGALKIGQRKFKYKNEQFYIKPQMLVIINSNEVHSCNMHESKIQSEYFVMYLDNDWCYEIQKSLFKDIKILRDFPICLLENPSLYEEFIGLCELFFSDEFTLKKEECLIEFMSKLYTQYLDLKIFTIKPNKLDIVITYLKNNIKENISLDELSNKFDINKYHLTRLFKKELGLSAHAYFLNLKINEAKELLKQNMSIADTALELGFVDQSHFHRHFSNIVAATPREYQNSI